MSSSPDLEAAAELGGAPEDVPDGWYTTEEIQARAEAFIRRHYRWHVLSAVVSLALAVGCAVTVAQLVLSRPSLAPVLEPAFDHLPADNETDYQIVKALLLLGFVHFTANSVQSFVTRYPSEVRAVNAAVSALEREQAWRE